MKFQVFKTETGDGAPWYLVLPEGVTIPASQLSMGWIEVDVETEQGVQLAKRLIMLSKAEIEEVGFAVLRGKRDD